MTLTSGIVAGIVVVAVTGAWAAWRRRHRVSIRGQYSANPPWYHVIVTNDAGHPLHVFEAGLIFGEKRYSSDNGILTLRGATLPPYSTHHAAFDVRPAEQHLGGQPTECFVRV